MKEKEMSRDCSTYGQKINVCWVLVKKLEEETNFSMDALIKQHALQQFHKL